ncbi:hypothetical protein INR49_004617 [Caranx melampygus]|nr:hypothetical protein INR49_004617 [Caranx melampygus]
MNSRVDLGGGQGGRRGGGGGRKVFLSAHRCPEVELLPCHDSETLIPPPCSLVPEFTCSGQSEANYLDVSSSCPSEGEDGRGESPAEEGEGSVSDWSEEDLSLHFSPSVILPSEDEESDTESGFNCVEVAVETKVEGHEGEGLKMVPKRQIHLKKKQSTEKLQVILNDGPSEGGGADNEVSSHELLCPTVRHRPDLLLRQHSMPASFCTRMTNSSDVDSNRVYRGLVAGASQDQQAVREGLGGALFRGPLHVVRDVRSLVKNTYNLSFSTATISDNHRPTSFKVIGQEDSPPPTYQQAVGVEVTRKTPSPEDTSPSIRLLHPPLLNNTRGQSPCSLPRNSAPPSGGPTSLTPAPPSSSSTTVPVLPAQHPHMGKVGYVHSPLSYFQIQLQPPPSAPTFQLLRRSEEDQSNYFMKSCPPQQTRTTEDQEGYVNTATAATQTLQQPFLSNVQGSLPAQVGSDLLVDITGSAVPPGALLTGPALCNVMLEPKSGQCYYLDMPPKHQRKMLLDPETGQFIQVSACDQMP